jgi:hypothetical protein
VTLSVLFEYINFFFSVDQQPPDFTMQNISDNINDDVQAASEPSNKSEVPGRRKTSDNVTGRRNAGEVSDAKRNLSPGTCPITIKKA